MKNTTKRVLAWTLLLAMCLSLLPAGLAAQAATVEYVYAGEYIKNWGTRDTTATFLSPNAESFYAQNDITYEELAALSGASATGSVPSSALYLQLQALMQENHTNLTSYDDTRDLYQYTDCQGSGTLSSKISSFYSGTEIGPAWDSGTTWNREHTWPNSKGLEGRDEDDIMMLRPTAKSENSSRGNAAYGESSGYYDPNGLGMTLRGDVARIMLYQYVRWGNTGYMWGSSGVMESKEVLLKWMEEDPVDTWELGRNDSVESVTGTRNVFVDYPELAFVLFDAEIPDDYITPSGKAVAGDYEITALSSNSDWGSVSVSGYTVNASPKTGYEVTGYTLLGGTAEVSRNGNAFTLVPTSDVTVRIEFAPRTQRTVKLAQLGVVSNTLTAYDGDIIQLPAHTGAVQEEYTFMGWVESAVEKTETLPSFYPVGGNYTVTRDITLYALYAKTEGSDTGSGNVFAPYSGQLTEGDYIIVYEDCAMVAALTDKNRLQYAQVTYTGDNIVSPAADTVWQFASVDGYWTMYNAASGKYAGGSGVKNVAALLDSVTDFAKWTEQADGSTYEFVNKGNDEKGVNPLLRKNGSVGFACYAKNTTVGGALSLYKRQESGTTYYLTGNPTVSDQDGNVYETLGAALENAAQGSKLTLLRAISEDVTVSKTVALDLAGFSIDGCVTVADGCTLYGMDAQTDDFTVEDAYGYGRIREVVCQGTGQVTGLEEESALAGCGYMMVKEADGVSFHCVALKLTAMSLRASQAGVYFKSSFAGDQVVERNLDSFGVALSIVGTPTAQTMDVSCGYSQFFQFVSGSNATSTLLKGIMKQTNTAAENVSNADTVIYGRAYMLTNDGQYVFGASVERTLRQQVEAVDTLWNTLTAEQQAGVVQMYKDYEAVMQDWYLPNLKGTLEEETPDTPVQTGYVKVTDASQLTDGQYVMIVGTGYAPGVYDSGWLSAVEPVVEGNVVTDPTGCVWTLSFDGSSVTITDASGVTVAPSGGNKNGIKDGDYQWVWSFEDGVATFTGTGSDTVTLASNATATGANRFRGYKTTTVSGSPTNYPNGFTLYKYTEE